MRIQKAILGAVALVGIGVAVLTAGGAFADQGSGQSAANRNDDFVVICHYDRNNSGPNAGPHTITIDRSALERHLANHVKKEGFVGDDSIGPCPGVPQPSTTPAPSPSSVSGSPTAGATTSPTP